MESGWVHKRLHGEPFYNTASLLGDENLMWLPAHNFESNDGLIATIIYYGCFYGRT